MEILIRSEEEMMTLGNSLASVLSAGDVVYLRGMLGAGKTVLVRGVARALGYSGPVTSPTFTLMNVYETQPCLFHFDFYRLQGADLEDLGLEDYLEGDAIVMIEWPQVGTGVLPWEALIIDIELADGDYDRERLVRFTARGRQYEEEIERLKCLVDTGR